MKPVPFTTFLIFDFLFFLSFLMAQAPDVLWTRSYGFREYEIAVGAYELPSGDFLVGASQQDTATYDYAGWIFRVDASGNPVTEHHTGYNDLDEFFNSMCAASDHTFVLTGSAENPDDELALYAIRADTNAVVVGANRLGTSHIGYGVTALPSGQCVFVGEINTTPNKGMLIWTFPDLGYMFQNIYQGFSRLELYSVNQTRDSCLIATGPVQINPYESRFFYLMKMDSVANCINHNYFGFGGDDQIPYWVEATTDGGYIMCGYTTVDGMANVRDLYIVKADSFLNLEWTRRYAHSEGRMIISHPEGGYVVAGNDRWPQGALIMRLDENGDSLWAKSIPGGLGNSVSLTKDGGYIIAGATGYTVANKNDAFLARLGPDPLSVTQETPAILSGKFNLLPNYPNPFNPVTHIRYQILTSTRVKLSIYDVLGKEVTTLVNERQPAGVHSIAWNATNYPTGVYFYKLSTEDFTAVRKMLLVK